MFKKLLAILLITIAFVVGTYAFLIRKLIASSAEKPVPSETVTSAKATAEDWQSSLNSVGSLTAVQGVMITDQLDGTVVSVPFQPGASVKAGDLLVQMDISSEEAQLQAADAAVELARLNLVRSKELLAKNTIAPSQLDADEASFKQNVAQSDGIKAAIAKKTLRAPFAGRLGVRLVNVGQTLKAGDPIVSLQALDPIFVDLYLPQQELSRVAVGQSVKVTCDAFPGQSFDGKVTAINPDVDSATRNVRIQATLANSTEKLRPGMFVDVQVLLSEVDKVVSIPTTAVLYAPYGDSVFIVTQEKDEKTGDMKTVAQQKFVKLGRKRGDFVSVTSGLAPGDTIVSSGAFKLRNGEDIVIDNSLAPDAKLQPTPDNS